MNETVWRRRIERHCAATIRALSSVGNAEFRAQRLLINERAVALRTPHLRVDVIDSPLVRSRGVADALALRLCYSDQALHQALTPHTTIGGIIFDILEQLRVETLVPRSLKGVRRNLEQAFDLWCLEARGSGLAENEIGLMVFSVTHIVRSRLRNERLDDEIDMLTEVNRFRLAPRVGVQLAKLRQARNNQTRYAKLALAIARVVDEICHNGGEGEELTDTAIASRYRMLLPPSDDEVSQNALHGSGAMGTAIAEADDNPSDYQVFTREYDVCVEGSALYREKQCASLRERLDQLIAAQAVSVSRLALRLQRLFSIEQASGWNFGEEAGYLDGRRISQLVANPAYRHVFRQTRYTPHSDVVVSFLVDNSGSMKRQRYEAVAVLVDVFARALELAGAKTEILGFTTTAWSGGRTINQWRRAGKPTPAGRMNELLHIVYKDADTHWRRARHSIAAMLNPQHFREGVDGEALAWAAQRLSARPESRRALVVISDGAPMDTATLNLNDKGYLDRHLRHIACGIEQRGEIALRAMGISLDMGAFFKHSIVLDLTGTLGNRAFSALELLYAARPPAAIFK